MGYNPLVNGIYWAHIITHLLTIDPNFQRDIQVIAEMIQFNEKIFQFGGSTRDLRVNTWCPVAQTCPPGGSITTPKNPRSFAIREVWKIQRIIQVCGPETKSCVCVI